VVRSRCPGARSIPGWRGHDRCAEWVGPYDDEKLGLHKVAKFYYAPGWWEGGTQIHVFTNLEKWNSLPPSYKAIVRSAADATNMWMTAKYDAVNPPALKKLVSEGAVLRVFPQPVMEASLKAANEVYAEISATNADFKKIWDNIKGSAISNTNGAGRGIQLRQLHDPQWVKS